MKTPFIALDQIDKRYPSRPFQRSAQPSSPCSDRHHQPDVPIATAGSTLKICQSSARERSGVDETAVQPDSVDISDGYDSAPAK